MNLHDYFDAQSTGTAEPVQHEVDEPGMDAIRDPDQEVYRYYENGVYRLYKRFDHAGRLIVRDWFNENRGRTRRDEFKDDGTIRRTTYMDLHYNKPRQEIYYRADGTPYMNKWLAVDPVSRTSSVERITMLDERGAPVPGADEQRRADPVLPRPADRRRPRVPVGGVAPLRRRDADLRPAQRQAGLRPAQPAHRAARSTTWPRSGRRTSPLLDQHERLGAIVFLTNAQRADAEAVYGEQANFRGDPAPGRTGRRRSRSRSATRTWS